MTKKAELWAGPLLSFSCLTTPRTYWSCKWTLWVMDRMNRVLLFNKGAKTPSFKLMTSASWITAIKQQPLRNSLDICMKRSAVLTGKKRKSVWGQGMVSFTDIEYGRNHISWPLISEESPCGKDGTFHRFQRWFSSLFLLGRLSRHQTLAHDAVWTSWDNFSLMSFIHSVIRDLMFLCFSPQMWPKTTGGGGIKCNEKHVLIA